MSRLSRLLSGIALTAVFCAGPNLLAQMDDRPAQDTQLASAASPMEFDVVSVKPNTSEHDMIGIFHKPDSVLGTNVSLKMLIHDAYGVREDLIFGGPGWVDSSAYDFEGKMTSTAADAMKVMTKDQRTAATRQMMQHALVDRFKLKIHAEKKTLPIYELVLAKGGSKLKIADPNNTYPHGIKSPEGIPKSGLMGISGNRMEGQGIAVTSIVNFLSAHLEYTVIDKTGLTGRYDVVLTWNPEDDPGSQANGASDSNSPHLFTALQEQLGLKLVSAKGSVDTLVIEGAEKPAEN